MSNTPETLAAILAEMRAGIHTGRADIIDIVNERLIAYADRIEAAAERERNAHTNDIHDALYKATGIPEHAVQVPAGAFAWLFAPAEEGEDHA